MDKLFPVLSLRIKNFAQYSCVYMVQIPSIPRKVPIRECTTGLWPYRMPKCKDIGSIFIVCKLSANEGCAAKLNPPVQVSFLQSNIAFNDEQKLIYSNIFVDLLTSS